MCVSTGPFPAGITEVNLRDWTQQAMDAWNVVNANVEFRLTGLCTSAVVLGDQVNQVGFTVFNPNDSAAGAAHTRESSGRILEADVRLRLSMDLSGLCWTNVLVHELGHVLGFTHSEYRSEVMGYGPCAVLQPALAEVSILAATYGPRVQSLSAVTSPPTSAVALTLTGRQQTFESQAGAYYYRPMVNVSGGNALVLSPTACRGIAGRTDLECTEHQQRDANFWVSHPELVEVTRQAGETVIEGAGTLGLFAREIAACNTVGCGVPFDARAGEVRAGGTGVDFGYFVHTNPQGGTSVQLVNTSFYLPPNFLDVAAPFEVRLRGVSGAAGLAGTCSLNLGAACRVEVDVSGQDLELLVARPDGSRTGVWVEGVGAAVPPAVVVPPLPATPGASVIVGVLPSQGLALALWSGGPLSAAASDPRIASIWITSNGALRGYTVGAPAFVNASFVTLVGGELAANTPMIVIVRQ
ncbi:MAG: M57 family metalloprotease [Chloroflexi bacterium]|nr:M57 family metalloprotease [Chloroflexota bacterium]